VTYLAECDTDGTKRTLKMGQSHLGLPHNETSAALICRNSQLVALHGDLLYQISHKFLKTKHEFKVFYVISKIIVFNLLHTNECTVIL